MTSILWHVAEAFPPTRQGTILNSHRVIGIATNTLMVLNCALLTYIYDDCGMQFNVIPQDILPFALHTPRTLLPVLALTVTPSVSSSQKSFVSGLYSDKSENVLQLAFCFSGNLQEVQK